MDPKDMVYKNTLIIILSLKDVAHDAVRSKSPQSKRKPNQDKQKDTNETIPRQEEKTPHSNKLVKYLCCCCCCCVLFLTIKTKWSYFVIFSTIHSFERQKRHEFGS
jgi:hypothetical protein